MTLPAGPLQGAAPARRTWDTVVGRTVLVALVAASITAFVALAVSVPMIKSAVRQQNQNQLATLAEVTAATLESPRQGSLGRLVELLASQQTQAFLIFPGGTPPDGLSQETLAPVFEGEPVSTTAQVDGVDMFVEARPVGDQAAVVLMAPTERNRDTERRGVRLLVIALLAGLSAAVVVALVASQRVTRPLRRVADGAERLVAGQRDVLVSTEGPREVAEVAEVINRLSSALQQSEGRQREFLLSVSHELRTPLTAVTGYAEALSDGVVAGDEVPRAGGLMLEESRRLERLVADLLDLSRLGAADLQIEHRPVDLRELLLAAAEVWRDRCEREGLSLRVDVGDGALPITTDPDRVRQIIDNLAGNALRVTPRGGTIVLALHHEDGWAVLQVRDDGPGLTPEDQALAFEPGVLYERYRGVRPVGSGVGLALVGRLATRLGGTAVAGTAAEGGAAFTVRLPAGSAGA